MKKRKFLKNAALLSGGTLVAPSLILSACKGEEKKEDVISEAEETVSAATTSFALPEISYGYEAFPDIIDAMTMEIHHSKHHAGYTKKLNAALGELKITTPKIEDILKMDELPTAVRNNGGGYFNHTLYWDILTPGGSMSDNFKSLITDNFGSPEALTNELADAGKKRFGSGWAWLCQDADKKLFVSSTPNQDNPLMSVVDRQGNPILGIDVWEHAYYLKYQNKRGDYLKNVLTIINWDKVEGRLL